MKINPGEQHIDILDEVPDEIQSRNDLVENIKLLHLSGAMSKEAITFERLQVQTPGRRAAARP